MNARLVCAMCCVVSSFDMDSQYLSLRNFIKPVFQVAELYHIHADPDKYRNATTTSSKLHAERHRTVHTKKGMAVGHAFLYAAFSIASGDPYVHF